jgi:nitrous oxidase accessory protein NosD
MNPKKIIILIIGAILIAAIGILVTEKIKDAEAHPTGPILYVGGTGPNNYSSIQEAIDAATDNNKIFIFAGVYNEHLTVPVAVCIAGESTTDTIIEGGMSGTILTVASDGVMVNGLRFRYAGGKEDDALLYATSRNLSVQDCIFEYARHGIHMSSNTDLTIQNCTFYHTAIGIRTFQSTDVLLDQLTFKKNGIGILSTTSTSLAIQKIYGELNGVTIMMDDCESIFITDCLLFNGNENQVNLYAERTSNIMVERCTIFHSGRGIRLAECNHATINSSWVYDSKIGIETNTVHHLRIENSRADRNDVGIYLTDSESVVIANSAICQNFVANLAAEGSSADARDNWWGSPLARVVTTHTKGGRIITFPGLKENPLEPIDTAVGITKHLPLQSAPPATIVSVDSDTDGDGIPDWWENRYGYSATKKDDHLSLDPDQDGLNNYEECLTNQWGSNPFIKDLFIEIDIMDDSYGLSEKKIEQMYQRFANHGINLHIDDGIMNGGEVIEQRDYVNYGVLIDLYWEYFLHNNPTNWRKGVFHYVVLSDSLFKSMPGFVFIGWDEADAFSLSMEYYEKEIPQAIRSHVLATVFMHELGHTLGLFHDVFPGIDNESHLIPFLTPFIKGQLTYYRYLSCMSYQYAWQILDYSDGSRGKGDFNDWKNIDLTFFQHSHWSPA